MNKIKPLSPSEVLDKADSSIPDVVIKAVNNLLVNRFRNGIITILQKDIVKEIIKLDSSISATIIYENGWLDFEGLYRKQGWLVEYDKPAYCENYDAVFKFRKK